MVVRRRQRGRNFKIKFNDANDTFDARFQVGPGHGVVMLTRRDAWLLGSVVVAWQ